MRPDARECGRLRREAYRLARETFDEGVTEARLTEIRDRLLVIDTVLYGRIVEG